MKFFKRTVEAVRRGLSRTAGVLGGGLRALLSGRRLDDDLVDQIESSLISADVGGSWKLLDPGPARTSRMGSMATRRRNA